MVFKGLVKCNAAHSPSRLGRKSQRQENPHRHSDSCSPDSHSLPPSWARDPWHGARVSNPEQCLHGAPLVLHLGQVCQDYWLIWGCWQLALDICFWVIVLIVRKFPLIKSAPSLTTDLSLRPSYSNVNKLFVALSTILNQWRLSPTSWTQRGMPLCLTRAPKFQVGSGLLAWHFHPSMSWPGSAIASHNRIHSSSSVHAFLHHTLPDLLTWKFISSFCSLLQMFL